MAIELRLSWGGVEDVGVVGSCRQRGWVESGFGGVGYRIVGIEWVGVGGVGVQELGLGGWKSWGQGVRGNWSGVRELNRPKSYFAVNENSFQF